MNAIRWAPLCLALAACSPHSASREPPPLQGARIGGPFSLVDQNGRHVTEASWPGRYKIVYFGYTFCPDVCPTDMANIGGAMRLLDARAPDLAKRIVPIFITVDPARDTPDALRHYVAAFDPRLEGLTGPPAAIAAAAKAYAILFSKGEASAGGGYMVNHSVQAYLMSPDNKPLALLPVEQNPQAVADEIQRWAM